VTGEWGRGGRLWRPSAPGGTCSLNALAGDGLAVTSRKPGSSRQLRIAVSLCGASCDDSQSCAVVIANGDWGVLDVDGCPDAAL
jgi:hypothetical protein